MGTLQIEELASHIPLLNTVSVDQKLVHVSDLKFEMFDAGGCMIAPVNNFLKSPSQLERDFRSHALAENGYSPVSHGKIIPIDEALQGCMEENY